MTEAEKIEAEKKAKSLRIWMAAITIGGGGLAGYLYKHIGEAKGKTIFYVLGGMVVVGGLLWGTSKAMDYMKKVNADLR